MRVPFLVLKALYGGDAVLHLLVGAPPDAHRHLHTPDEGNNRCLGFDCMMLVYPFLGRDTNVTLTYPKIVTTRQMPPTLSTMIERQFMQLSDIVTKGPITLEHNRLVIHTIVSTYLILINGFTHWRREQTVAGGMESSTQSYRIMSRLYDIFEEPEALRHRDAQYFASRLNITTRYFYEVCMKEAGMSAKDFVSDVIVSEIKHRLLNTSLSFQQISQQFNFPDQAAFTLYFKRHVGTTPSEYRRKYR